MGGGYTTLALTPPGRTMPGRQLIIRTAGKSPKDLIIDEREMTTGAPPPETPKEEQPPKEEEEKKEGDQ